MEKVECVVVGAGVIGLAVARRLAQAGREVIILEAAEGIGTVTSSRNSEVIHAGIYYPAGSLMARMCVSGKRALYRLLPRSWHPASQLRQADRRDDAERRPQSCNRSGRTPKPMALPICRRSRRGRARAGAGAELRRRPALAFHRHRRQPRLHAGAAGRRRRSGRGFCLSQPAVARQGGSGPDRARGRRRRADDP